MDWANISLAAVAVLGPYLTEAGKSMAKKIGEDFYTWLKQRFEKDKDNDVNMALSLLEKKPDSETRRNVLAEAITKTAEDDPEGFGMELQSRIQQISTTEGEIGALVGQIVAGKVTVVNNMYGDIKM